MTALVIDENRRPGEVIATFGIAEKKFVVGLFGVARIMAFVKLGIGQRKWKTCDVCRTNALLNFPFH
jgi:hypothetical protein